MDGLNKTRAGETEAGGVNGWADPSVGKYSNSGCMDLHEETHAYIAVEEFNKRIAELRNSGIFELAIDCDEPATTDCFGAFLIMGPDIYSGIEKAFSIARAASDEDLPREAAPDCFRAIADAICNDPRWDCSLCG
jgi:hypothetical protein